MRTAVLILVSIVGLSCAGWWQRHNANFQKTCAVPPNDVNLISCSCMNAGTPDCYPPPDDNGDNPSTMARDPAAKRAALARYNARAAGYLPCGKVTPAMAATCYDRSGAIQSLR